MSAMGTGYSWYFKGECMNFNSTTKGLFASLNCILFSNHEQFEASICLENRISQASLIALSAIKQFLLIYNSSEESRKAFPV